MTELKRGWHEGRITLFSLPVEFTVCEEKPKHLSCYLITHGMPMATSLRSYSLIHRWRSAIDRLLRDRSILAPTTDPSLAQRDRSIAQIGRSRITYICIFMSIYIYIYTVAHKVGIFFFFTFLRTINYIFRSLYHIYVVEIYDNLLMDTLRSHFNQMKEQWPFTKSVYKGETRNGYGSSKIWHQNRKQWNCLK